MSLLMKVENSSVWWLVWGGGRWWKGLNGEAEREGVVRGAGQSWGLVCTSYLGCNNII